MLGIVLRFSVCQIGVDTRQIRDFRRELFVIAQCWRAAEDDPRLFAYSRRGDVVLADGIAVAGDLNAALAGQRRYRVRR